jgi:hypothetical protein
VEGQSEDGKPMISDQTFLAIQVTGDWEVSHPRVCWHSQIQVGIFFTSLESSSWSSL